MFNGFKPKPGMLLIIQRDENLPKVFPDCYDFEPDLYGRGSKSLHLFGLLIAFSSVV